jgi:hypothetical protein
VQETTFYNGGPFSSNQYTNPFSMTLVRSGETWQITAADNYFSYCWTQKEGCR